MTRTQQTFCGQRTYVVAGGGVGEAELFLAACDQGFRSKLTSLLSSPR